MRSSSLRRASTVIVLLPVMTMLPACTSSPTNGRLVGTNQPCMGPIEPSPRIRADYTISVRILRRGRVVAKQNVRRPYRFSFVLEPGRYRAEATGDRPAVVMLHKGRSTTVSLRSPCI